MTPAELKARTKRFALDIIKFKSDKDFISKMSTAEEEADESGLWLEVLTESGLARQAVAARLLDEANQLTRIFVASINTARKRSGKQKTEEPEIEDD